MFFKTSDLMFMSFTAMGTLIAISANSWFTAWLGLEINLLSVTPLILSKLSPSLSEASIKYFLTQALASLFLIFSSASMLYSSEFLSSENKNILITISILIKAGLVPFHFWFPQVIKLLSWTQSMIMFTWQKIAPLVLISFTESKILIFISMLSALWGSVMGLNQNNLKLLLTFSSISHSGWMVLSSIISFSVLASYMIIYFMITISMILMFNGLKVMKIKNLHLKNQPYLYMLAMSLNFMSLGGMPPLLGFVAKLPALLIIAQNKMLFTLSVLILSSLISLYFYTRIIYSSLMFKTIPISMSNKKNKFINLLVITSILLNLSIFIII